MSASAEDEAWAQLLRWVRDQVRAAGDKTLILGMVGLPGSGKSTFARRLLRDLALPHSLTVSLDDFYLTAAERQERGLRWRGPPGTHDLPRLDRFIAQLEAQAAPVTVPVFDREHEQRLPDVQVGGPLSLCLIEGWFVGARAPGYERLADALARLIYIDMEEAAARAARLGREAALRNSGHGGMTDHDVARFWAEALSPHWEKLVFPLRENAQVRLAVSATHRITALTLRPG